MLRVKRISAELAWICFGQLMVVAGGVFGVQLVTYRVGPSVYGDLAIGMTVAVLAQQIIFSPLGQSFLRYFSSAYKDGRLNVYIKTAGFLLVKAAVLIVIIAVILTIGPFLTGHTKWIWLFSLALLYSLFSGCNIVLNYIQNAARHRKIVALHQGVGQWLDFLIPVGLIVLWGPYGFIAILGYVVASAIILRSELRFFRSKIAVLGAITAGKNVDRYSKQICKNNIGFCVAAFRMEFIHLGAVCFRPMGLIVFYQHQRCRALFRSLPIRLLSDHNRFRNSFANDNSCAF